MERDPTEYMYESHAELYHAWDRVSQRPKCDPEGPIFVKDKRGRFVALEKAGGHPLTLADLKSVTREINE